MTLSARRRSKGYLGLVSGPDVPGGRPRVFCACRACTHRNTLFLPLTCARRSDSLCSDGVKSRRLNVSVSQLWVLGRRTSIFPGRCCVHHAAGGGYSLQDVWRSRSRRSRLSSLGRSGAVFSFIVLQDALNEVLKVCPPMKLKFFVDEITALMEGRSKELAGIEEKVLRAMRMEVEEKEQTLSLTEGRKEGKSKVIASCGYLEENLHECSKKKDWPPVWKLQE